MKVPAGRIDAFVRSPDASVLMVLLYGPDAGLVRERADALTAAVAGGLDDPFRVVRLDAGDLAADPARLADEAGTLAFGGGRRVVRVDARYGPKPALTGLRVLADTSGPEAARDALVVVEAGDLGWRDALRRLFEETTPGAAALPCYLDEDRDVAALVRDILAPLGLRASADAVAFLADNLGNDRLVTRRELEKLALYASKPSGEADSRPREVGLEDAVASVGDSSALDLEDLAFAVGGGDPATLDRTLSRLFREGVGPVPVLRAVTRHFQRLHLVAGRIAAGAAPDACVKALRPPVFWKRATAFGAQARRWPVSSLEAALKRLSAAELACKSTGTPVKALCGHTLYALASAAPSAPHRR